MTFSRNRSSKTTRAVLAGTALGALLLTTGCSTVQDLTENILGNGNTSIAWASEPAGEPIWTVDAQPVGYGPQIVGDTVVSYVMDDDDDLKLVGYDLATGEQRWSHAGVTGNLNPAFALRLSLFEGADGSMLTSNILEATATPPNDEGRYFWNHPVQVVDVKTGEVRATSPAERFISTPQGCVQPDLACYSAHNQGGPVEILSVNEKGELGGDPNALALPDFASVHQGKADGFTFGISQDGTPTAAFLKDGNSKWTVPMSEMGFENLSQAQHPGHFDDFRDWDDYVTDDGIAIYSGGTAATAEGVTNFHTSAFNSETGEKLWTVDKFVCDSNVLCDGAMKSEKGSDNKTTYPEQDMTLSGFDPSTGEPTWTSEVSGMTFNFDDKWYLAGDDAAVLKTSDGVFILDTTNGELKKLAEGQYPLCFGEGEDFWHKEAGRPDNNPVAYGANIFVQGCAGDKTFANPAAFTKTAVAAGSWRPKEQKDSTWDVFEEQVRVIPTKEGIAAYRF